jgi:hypothetical protein
MEKPEGKLPLRIHRLWLEDNIKMDLTEIGWGKMDWIYLVQDRDRLWSIVDAIMKVWVP